MPSAWPVQSVMMLILHSSAYTGLSGSTDLLAPQETGDKKIREKWSAFDTLLSREKREMLLKPQSFNSRWGYYISMMCWTISKRDEIQHWPNYLSCSIELLQRDAINMRNNYMLWKTGQSRWMLLKSIVLWTGAFIGTVSCQTLWI